MNIKSHLVSFLLLATGLSLNAQVSVGLKTHYGTAWQEYGKLPINGFDQRIDGYGLSAEFTYQLNPHFQIKARPGYIRRGAACEPGFLPSPNMINADPIFLIATVEDATIYTNYIEFPILFSAQWELVNRLSLFVEGGGGIAYMLNGYRTIQFSTKPPGLSIDRDLNFKDEKTLNRFDFGLHSGLGLSYQLGRGHFNLSGNYYHGILDVTDTNTSKNRSLSLGLGYVIVLK